MKTNTTMDPEKVVKCACGLTMRQKDWAGHWYTCYKGSSVPVTEQDRVDLEYHEEHLRQAAREHQEWLEQRKETAHASTS